MGDAGPLAQDALLEAEKHEKDSISSPKEQPREIKVLVTGFGPFKSFLINPSWLIASALPGSLLPTPPSEEPKYTIKLIVYPSPVRVAYETLYTLVPQLIAEHDPDLILHIGMAGGRDVYSLETRASREGYRIKDVDECDGHTSSQAWANAGLPDMLWTGWDEDDVLARWSAGVEAGLRDGGFLGPVPLGSHVPGAQRRSTLWGTTGSGMRAEENRRRGIVKLSRDAGRFVCEFALYTSLAKRWSDVHREPGGDNGGEDDRYWRARECLGRVAFLHVPGWTGVEDVARGVMIAEESIKALVASWEAGRRRRGETSVPVPATASQQSKQVPAVSGGTGAESAWKSKFTNQQSEAHGDVAEVRFGTVRMGIGSGGILWRELSR